MGAAPSLQSTTWDQRPRMASCGSESSPDPALVSGLGSAQHLPNDVGRQIHGRSPALVPQPQPPRSRPSPSRHG